MGSISSIEWTESTWNPLVGCTKVSQGCKNCYAMTMAARIANAAQKCLRQGKTLTDVQAAYRKVVRWRDGGMDPGNMYDVALAQWNGRVELVESALMAPLSWKKPRRVFVNSMSDLFHESVPFEFVDRVFVVMALCPQHTFQVLTKRPDRMAEYTGQLYRAKRCLIHESEGMFMKEPLGTRERRLSDAFGGNLPGDPKTLPNVWLGTSVENQATADSRIPHLLKCPAAVRFLSCEPLLGFVDLTKAGAIQWDSVGGVTGAGYEEFQRTSHSFAVGLVDWVIVGGESGFGARAMHPDWPRALLRQCKLAEIPFFFKQWGAWKDGSDLKSGYATVLNDGACYLQGQVQAQGHIDHWRSYNPVAMSKVGKGRAGRLLDGEEHNGMPEVRS